MKPRVLLCWGYHRQAWVEPFERLADRFEFTFLSELNPSAEQSRRTSLPVVYWDDFRSAAELLDALAPRKIVMMSVASGRAIALNLAAQSRGIPTYVLQHGLFQSFASYKALLASLQATGDAAGAPAGGGGRKTLAYLLRSMAPTQITQLPAIAAYFAVSRARTQLEARRWVRGAFRRPSGFICYTHLGTRIYRELHRAKDADFELIGIPEFDAFFDGEASVETEPYALLIDTPLAENRYGQRLVTKDEMVRFYESLNAHCERLGLRLKVKLHPASHGQSWQPRLPNIDWYEDADIVSLVRRATHCYSFHSNLMIPVVYSRPTCLLRLIPSPEIDHMVELGVAVAADFHGFRPEAVDFGRVRHRGAGFERFIRDYLFATDGRSCDRLGAILER